MRGALWNRSQERALRKGQLVHVLAKVESRRLFDPIAPVPECNVVEIQIQNVVLAEFRFDAPREDPVRETCVTTFVRASAARS